MENQIENQNYITIVENGVEKKVELLSYFSLKSNDKKYVAYTDNQEDQEGNVIISTAEVVSRDDGGIDFVGITDPNVVEEVKNVLLDLAK